MEVLRKIPLFDVLDGHVTFVERQDEFLELPIASDREGSQVSAFDEAFYRNKYLAHHFVPILRVRRNGELTVRKAFAPVTDQLTQYLNRCLLGWDLFGRQAFSAEIDLFPDSIEQYPFLAFCHDRFVGRYSRIADRIEGQNRILVEVFSIYPPRNELFHAERRFDGRGIAVIRIRDIRSGEVFLQFRQDRAHGRFRDPFFGEKQVSSSGFC